MHNRLDIHLAACVDPNNLADDNRSSSGTRLATKSALAMSWGPPTRDRKKSWKRKKKLEEEKEVGREKKNWKRKKKLEEKKWESWKRNEKS